MKIIRPNKHKKGEGITRYIKHLAESANFKGSAFYKHCNGLIGNRVEMPNVSYTHPLCAILRDITILRINLEFY